MQCQILISLEGISHSQFFDGVTLFPILSTCTIPPVTLNFEFDKKKKKKMRTKKDHSNLKGLETFSKQVMTKHVLDIYG